MEETTHRKEHTQHNTRYFNIGCLGGSLTILTSWQYTWLHNVTEVEKMTNTDSHVDYDLTTSSDSSNKWKAQQSLVRIILCHHKVLRYSRNVNGKTREKVVTSPGFDWRRRLSQHFQEHVISAPHVFVCSWDSQFHMAHIDCTQGITPL